MVASVPTSTLLSLAHYHLWAYKQVINGLKSMKDEDYYGHAGLVFRSIHGTLNHVHAADVNWYCRLTNKYPEGYKAMQSLWRVNDCYSTKDSKESPWESFIKDRSELSKQVLKQAQEYIDFLSAMDPDTEIPPITFVTSGGIEFKDQDVGLTLLHIFNHGTHHRGQITAGVTNLGYPPLDGLDYLYFLRLNQQYSTLDPSCCDKAITADFDLSGRSFGIMTVALLCFNFCFDHSEISSQCSMDDLHPRLGSWSKVIHTDFCGWPEITPSLHVYCLVNKSMVCSVPLPTLLSLARFHHWAYKLLLDGLQSVSDEDYYGHAGLVFRSIHGTLNHAHIADVTWCSRLHNQYRPDYADMLSLWRHNECYSTKDSKTNPWESFVRDRSELSKQILKQTQDLVDFLSVFEEDAEIPALSFVTSAGIEFKDQDVGLILLNLFNHATYHRGQITAGVTNLGYPPIDGLDFIFFLRADEQ